MRKTHGDHVILKPSIGLQSGRFPTETVPATLEAAPPSGEFSSTHLAQDLITGRRIRAEFQVGFL